MTKTNDEVTQIFGDGSAETLAMLRSQVEEWEKLEPGRKRTTVGASLAEYVRPLADIVEAATIEIDALQMSLKLAATLVSRVDLDRLVASVGKMRDAQAD